MKINVNKLTGITIQQERYVEEKIIKFNIEQAKEVLRHWLKDLLLKTLIYHLHLDIYRV